MGPMMMPAAHVIADLVAGTGDLKVLDIAAGHGLFGITIAQRNPHAEIVAVDWPSVLTVATEHARAADVQDRHRTLPGDAFKVEFPGGFDVALVTNFLHHFDRPTCTSFLEKVSAGAEAGRSGRRPRVCPESRSCVATRSRALQPCRCWPTRRRAMPTRSTELTEQLEGRGIPQRLHSRAANAAAPAARREVGKDC